MTNEQLYILLESIADELATEIVALKSNLANVAGVERNPNFYDKDGHKHYGFSEDWPGEDIEGWAKKHNLEICFDGDIIFLNGLNYLLRRIRERSRALRK